LSSLRAERVEEEEESDVGAGAVEDDGNGRERVVTGGSGKVFI